jgi:hypothetical protein
VLGFNYNIFYLDDINEITSLAPNLIKDEKELKAITKEKGYIRFESFEKYLRLPQ